MSHNTFGHLFRVTTFGESHVSTSPTFRVPPGTLREVRWAMM